MKILNIAPNGLFPIQAGNQINTYNLCKYLKECGHDIGYLFIDYGLDYSPPNSDSLFFHDYTAVNGAFGSGLSGLVKRAINRIAKILGRSNIDPVFLLRQKDITAIKELINSQKYEAIIVHYAVLGNLLDRLDLPQLKTAIFTHDLQFIREKRIKEAQKGHKFSLRPSKTESIELKLYRKFDSIIVVSSYEHDILLKKGFPCSQVTLGGVSHDSIDTRNTHTKWDLLFVGAKGNWPNVEGMLWFLNKIWPEIIKKKPNATIAIAGSICSALEDKYSNNKGIHLLGFVDDLSDLYSKCKIVIAPLFTGSGVKVKVVEALAHGKALITTDIGSEGIPIKHKEHYIRAEDDSEWVEAISTLLDSAKLSRNLENNALKWAASYASPSAVWGEFEQKLSNGRN